jgi:hypothetical protein
MCLHRNTGDYMMYISLPKPIIEGTGSRGSIFTKKIGFEGRLLVKKTLSLSLVFQDPLPSSRWLRSQTLLSQLGVVKGSSVRRTVVSRDPLELYHGTGITSLLGLVSLRVQGKSLMEAPSTWVGLHSQPGKKITKSSLSVWSMTGRDSGRMSHLRYIVSKWFQLSFSSKTWNSCQMSDFPD